MCFNREGAISFVSGSHLKLVDNFTYLGSSILSTEGDVNIRLAIAWTAIDRLSIIWKSYISDRIERDLFQAMVVSILLYGCTTWSLTLRIEKRLDGNCTRMLRVILNKSWKQQPTKQQLSSRLPLFNTKKNIQVWRTSLGTLLEKQDRTHKWRSPIDPYTWTYYC